MSAGFNPTEVMARPTDLVQLHVGDPGPDGTENVSAGSSARLRYDPPLVWTNEGAVEHLEALTVWDADGAFLFPVDLRQWWHPGDTYTLTQLSFRLLAA